MAQTQALRSVCGTVAKATRSATPCSSSPAAVRNAKRYGRTMSVCAYPDASSDRATAGRKSGADTGITVLNLRCRTRGCMRFQQLYHLDGQTDMSVGRWPENWYCRLASISGE